MLGNVMLDRRPGLRELVPGTVGGCPAGAPPGQRRRLHKLKLCCELRRGGCAFLVWAVLRHWDRCFDVGRATPVVGAQRVEAVLQLDRHEVGQSGRSREWAARLLRCLEAFILDHEEAVHVAGGCWAILHGLEVPLPLRTPGPGVSFFSASPARPIFYCYGRSWASPLLMLAIAVWALPRRSVCDRRRRTRLWDSGRWSSAASIVPLPDGHDQVFER